MCTDKLLPTIDILYFFNEYIDLPHGMKPLTIDGKKFFKPFTSGNEPGIGKRPADIQHVSRRYSFIQQMYHNLTQQIRLACTTLSEQHLYQFVAYVAKDTVGIALTGKSCIRKPSVPIIGKS